MIRRRALLSLIEYKQIEPSIRNNVIRYIATAKVEANSNYPWVFDTFGANVVSHEWNSESGEGVITFDGEVTTIGNIAFSDCDSLTSITIPDNVTTIGEYAFDDCDSLTSITIPDSVTTIGDDAFNNCYDLTSVTIGDSVTTIGERAFHDCSSLTGVTIPDSVTTIEGEAFGYCDSLTSVTIGDSVTTIGSYVFYGCDSLTSVTIPDSITTIGDGVFGSCTRLTSVYCKSTTPPSLGGTSVFDYNSSGRKIYVPTESVDAYKTAEYWSEYAPSIVGYDFENGDIEEVQSNNEIWYTSSDGNVVTPYYKDFGANIISNEYNNGKGVITFDSEVTMISDYAFLDDLILESITIPGSATSIGEYAFRDCGNLTSVTINDGVTTIKTGAFYNCENLTSVTIPDSLTTIREGVFSGCKSLTSANIGDSVTEIGSSAFYNCNSLTSVNIGDSVTTIGEGAFYFCDSLTSVTIPDSVTTIRDGAFQYCDSLTSVYCKATTPPSLGGTWVFDSNGSGRKIYVPTGSVDAYKTAEYWSEYADAIVGYDFNTTYSIMYTSSDGNIVIPNNINVFGATITNNVYINGKGYITFDEPITTIGSYAFDYCDSLTSVTIPDSVTSIGTDAFRGCSSLTSVTIPDSVTTIEMSAFYSCDSLTSITIPDSVTTIGYEAFRGCSSLTSVTIGDSVTTIKGSSFYSCDSLTSVYCKATTPPSLGDNDVFDYNGSGRKIYVPAGSVEAYKSSVRWSEYADVIEGYDFEEENGNLITFTVDGIEYQAEEGMTWGQFCNSEYNTGNFIIKNDFIYTTDNKIVNDNNSVHKMSSDEKVISGGVYYITFPEPE